VSEAYLEPVTRVVSEILRHDTDLAPNRIMIVGAFCRDILHEALGHRSPLRPTNDLDVALALTGWETYASVIECFDRVPSASNDIRYSIAGEPVDLLAFGDVEEPTGSVTPPPRDEPLSVWGFEEIHRASVDLSLMSNMTIRLPSVPGYTAAKLMAWLDRSDYGEVKDAQDLALTAFWYGESEAIAEDVPVPVLSSSIVSTRKAGGA
jgi:predicted nucleotidyltransferase